MITKSGVICSDQSTQLEIFAARAVLVSSYSQLAPSLIMLRSRDRDFRVCTCYLRRSFCVFSRPKTLQNSLRRPLGFCQTSKHMRCVDAVWKLLGIAQNRVTAAGGMWRAPNRSGRVWHGHKIYWNPLKTGVTLYGVGGHSRHNLWRCPLRHSIMSPMSWSLICQCAY